MAKITKISDAKAAGAGVKDEPPALICCIVCKHWAQTANPAFGHCLLGAKSLPGPLVTTDLTSCTRAESKF